MNYRVSIDKVEITGNSMVIEVSGEIEDNQIAKGIFSKPKLILLFENSSEDRRIPFVINNIGYFGDKCFFSGMYVYRLDMLFWKTRNLDLPFTMKFALSYGNCYFDEIMMESVGRIIINDDANFMLEYSGGRFNFKPIPRKNSKVKAVFSKIGKFFSLILHIVLYILGICLIPIFFIESILGLLNVAKLAVGRNGNAIGIIVGHINRRIEQLSGIKITVRKINRRLILLFYKIFSLQKVKKNRITFISARRNDISGNFAFVYDKLKDYDNLDIRFVLNDKTIRQLNIVDIIKFCHACTVSKVIVLDEFTPQIHFIDLKPETKLIQLWHACGAFKTFGFTRLSKPKGSPQTTRNHRSYDYVTVSSEYCKRCHSEGFGIPYDNVVPTGIPRTDIFFDDDYRKKVTAEFYEVYPQFKDKKIIMFAPTFRGNVKETANYPFEMFDVERICRQISDDYVIIVKHHPFIREKHPIPDELKGRVVDLSENTEINDLLFISDLIITDYSSLVFEASLLKIPMLFYVFDLDEYIRDRDFYFDLRLNSPGKLVFNEQELVEAINSEDYETERIEPFERMFFDKRDGKSTQRVVELILNSLKC